MAGITVPSSTITALARGTPRAVPAIINTGETTVFWGHWVTADGDWKVSDGSDEATNVVGMVDFDGLYVQNNPSATAFSAGEQVIILSECSVYTKAGSEVVAAPILPNDFVVLSSATEVQKYVDADHDITMIVGVAKTGATAQGDILEVDTRGWC